MLGRFMWSTALHCDFNLNPKSTAKCNPAAAAKNLHLCESPADRCFPLNQGLSASRLHDHFLRQFCDAHTCSGRKKLLARGRKEANWHIHTAASILTLMLLPVFSILLCI